MSELSTWLPQLAPYVTALGGMACARDAIKRVLGVSLDVALSPIDDYVQGIKDRRAGRSAVIQAQVAAVSKQIGEDPALVQRAAENFLRKEARYQRSREKIAAQAAEEVVRNPPTEDRPVDEDWLDLFSGYAEKATKDEVQNLWARILAGEIRAPGTFSRGAMRILAEIDIDTAKMFSEFSTHSFGGAIFGSDDPKFFPLNEIGLVVSDRGFQLEASAARHFVEEGYVLEVKSKTNEFINATILSRVGRELALLIDMPVVAQRAAENAARIKGSLRIISGVEMHWGPRISSTQWRREHSL